jgi:hypothetical protein
MTNPVSIEDQPVTLACSGVVQLIALTDRRYQVTHTGLNASLAADTNPIMLAYDQDGDATPTVGTSGAEGSNKTILTAGGPPLIIGPGVNILAYASKGGAPRLCIDPVGW